MKPAQGGYTPPAGGLLGPYREFFRRHWVRGEPGTETPPWVAALAYRTWLVALVCKLLGSSWDMSWHFMWLRDDLAPPHLLNTVGTVIVVVLVGIHTYTGMGCDRLALRLMQGGTAVFLIAAPLDVLNHRVNGLDLTAWSPSHGLLYFGTGLMIVGAIRGWLRYSPPGRIRAFVHVGLWALLLETFAFSNGQQEYGILELRSWERGAPYAEPTLLEFAAEQLGRPVDRPAVIHFALPIPDWVYPLWGVAVLGLVLVLARHFVARAWTATTVAALYVGYRVVTWPLLMFAGFPTSTVPFYLLAVGLAVDLTFRFARSPAARAMLGACLLTASGYGALFLQAQFAGWVTDAHTESAPPVAYWTIPVAAAAIAALWWFGALLVRRAHRRGEREPAGRVDPVAPLPAKPEAAEPTAP